MNLVVTVVVVPESLEVLRLAITSIIVSPSVGISDHAPEIAIKEVLSAIIN